MRVRGRARAGAAGGAARRRRQSAGWRAAARARTCCAGGKRPIAFSYTPDSATASWYVRPARERRRRRRRGTRRGCDAPSGPRRAAAHANGAPRARPTRSGHAPSLLNRSVSLPAYHRVKPFTRKDIPRPAGADTAAKQRATKNKKGRLQALAEMRGRRRYAPTADPRGRQAVQDEKLREQRIEQCNACHGVQRAPRPRAAPRRFFSLTNARADSPFTIMASM
jgi:hypothetical protein